MFASDEEVAPIVADLFAGWQFHALWGADAPPAFPDDGAPAPVVGLLPAARRRALQPLDDPARGHRAARRS